jgi:hypothetical protein
MNAAMAVIKFKSATEHVCAFYILVILPCLILLLAHLHCIIFFMCPISPKISVQSINSHVIMMFFNIIHGISLLRINSRRMLFWKGDVSLASTPSSHRMLPPFIMHCWPAPPAMSNGMLVLVIPPTRSFNPLWVLIIFWLLVSSLYQFVMLVNWPRVISCHTLLLYIIRLPHWNLFSLMSGVLHPSMLEVLNIISVLLMISVNSLGFIWCMIVLRSLASSCSSKLMLNAP